MNVWGFYRCIFDRKSKISRQLQLVYFTGNETQKSVVIQLENIAVAENCNMILKQYIGMVTT